MSDISTQCASFEPFWAAHRDNWKPCTPADVWGLMEDREFVPPSKAHDKRLRRVRSIVSPAQPYGHDSNGGRQAVNQRVQQGKRVLEACGCLPAPHAPIPSPYVRGAPVPPKPPGPVKPSDPDAAGKTMLRHHILALHKMVYNPWAPKSLIDVLRVLWAFGSVEAYHAAVAAHR